MATSALIHTIRTLPQRVQRCHYPAYFARVKCGRNLIIPANYIETLRTIRPRCRRVILVSRVFVARLRTPCLMAHFRTKIVHIFYVHNSLSVCRRYCRHRQYSEPCNTSQVLKNKHPKALDQNPPEGTRSEGNDTPPHG
jgi:hypothetical protein